MFFQKTIGLYLKKKTRKYETGIKKQKKKKLKLVGKQSNFFVNYPNATKFQEIIWSMLFLRLHKLNCLGLIFRLAFGFYRFTGAIVGVVKI